MDSRRIVMSGVSRGLGRAMTAGFVQQGHSVVGCARSEAAVSDLRDQFGAPHRFDVVDVSDDDQVAAWSKSVLSEAGSPDLLINNAATMNENAALWEVPVDEFSQVIEINIKGTFHLIRHFVPAMISAGSGVVVNFSSGWGRSTSPDVAPYCATKWAIEGLTQALADELPSGMAAVPLNPGVIHTDMLDSCFGASAASYPSPETWAKRAVPFILGITTKDSGQPLTVTG